MNMLDVPLAVTVFPDRAATTAKSHTITLRDLAGEARRKRAPDKASLPLVKLATFGARATDKGCLRNNANVETITGIEADYDAGAMPMAEAADKLRAAGVATLLYTSPSHTPAAPRWRCLVPLSAPHRPEDRRELAGRLNGILGGVLAAESFTLSQSFYIGGVGGPPETLLVDGAALDAVPNLIPVYPASRVAEALALPAQAPDQKPDEYVRAARDKALAAFATSDNRHMTLLAVTAALAPFVLSGHLDRDELVADIQDALGREAFPAEVGAALDGVLHLNDLRPYAPPSDGSEFPALPTLPTGRLRFLAPAECDGITARPYRVKGLLAEGDVGCLFGPPGAGKSLLAPLLAWSVAQGGRFFGLRSRQGVAWYLAAEDESGMRRRVTALRLAHGDAPAFRLVCGVSDLLNSAAGHLAELDAAVTEHRPALVVVDTLAMAWPGLIENDADGMGRVVATARQLARHGGAVLLVHHDTKARDGTPRGHSLLNGALDVAVALDPADSAGVIRGRLTKNRNGPCTLDVAFRIGVVTLGTDEDGDAITAAHAVELASDAVRVKPVHLSPTEAAAVALLPMDEEAWIEACAGNSTAQTPRDRTRSAQNMRLRLLNRGVIRRDGKSVTKASDDSADVFPGACGDTQRANNLSQALS